MADQSGGSPNAEFAIIGAGIAGVSVGAELAARGADVVVLDQYPEAPYGTTQRSAALFAKSYFSSEPFAVLTAASEHFFRQPPPGFPTSRWFNSLGRSTSQAPVTVPISLTSGQKSSRARLKSN